MNIEINKNSKVPLYLQIKEQLKKLLAEGQLKKGSQLPTERELSIKLNVSRNTVSMAYQELSQEKIVSSHPGKGTFVIADDTVSSNPFLLEEKHNLLINSIDLVIQQALDLNLKIDGFRSLFNQRLERTKHLLDHISIAFVECNQEQLYYFTKKLELGTGIQIVPLLIDEMHDQPENFLNKIRPVDLVVTTFFHYKEVQEFLKDQDKKITAIALVPKIETMVSIARVATNEMRLGLVCLTQKFAEYVFKSIKAAGINCKSISYTTTHDSSKLEMFIHKCDILIVSPGRKEDVKKFISKSIPLIEFIYIPDKGSINTMKETILDIKKEEGKNSAAKREYKKLSE